MHLGTQMIAPWSKIVLSTTAHKVLKAMPRQIHKVLLITYYRSGSSFLGESLKQNPHAFYLFEPFTDIFLRYNIHEKDINRDEM